ncbi:M50 family metallopeptidase [Corynebacterium choanae]|uniref:Zinc metalloprotease Rip1 n=1 Tax=Corynebacterium choanae TaxID=1862358 RepID=A0A3G6J702_9CORY|nr:M50 family metallopeptidase [Corynebacterium choanae]AZA13847.1 Zinc metalloprotease Rip1 [Corynebacterium choanae]
MGFATGAVLFAVGIALTIALHEFGHYLIARLSGMRVRRFFIGFGPTLWSVQRGHTTYGIKALPFGGFCDIAGMTSLDELTPEEAPYAMVRKSALRRIATLLGGIAMNILIGVTVLYVVAVGAGLPDPKADVRAVVESTSCVPEQQYDAERFSDCTGTGPAATAGVLPGDIIAAVDGETTRSFGEVAALLRQRPAQVATLTVERDGRELLLDVPVESVTRLVPNEAGELVPTTVGAIGVRGTTPAVWREYSAVSAVPAAVEFSGFMLQQTAYGLAKFPLAIPGVVQSVFGGDRDAESPMSVVGATRIGGELAAGSHWSAFLLMLASLNFFLALFNVLPVPPLDGGHVAIVCYEVIRDRIRRLRGLAPLGPVHYGPIVPIIVGVSALLVVVGVVIIVADIVNPISVL